MTRRERLEAAIPKKSKGKVYIVAFVAPGDLERPRKLRGYRGSPYDPNPEYFARGADESEEQCRTRVVAMLKDRGDNALIFEDREVAQ